MAYCLDEAVTHLGITIQADIDQSTEKSKTDKAARTRAQMTLDKWLKPVAKRTFADPAAMGKKIKTKKEVAW